MATEPDQLRADIEATRGELAGDVDRLADRTNPKRIVQRRWDRVKDGASSVRDRVMGATQEATDTVKEAPQAVTRSAAGNPLAAGLIAFGTGLLVATLIPESDAERAASQRIGEHSGQLKEMGRDLASDVQDTAREAAGHVTEAAKEAASQTVDAARQRT
jgi:hypothetical protein